MKNPFERPNPRDEFDETQRKMLEQQEKLKALEHPATYEKKDRFVGMSRGEQLTEFVTGAINDAVLRIPNIPEIWFRELRVEVARKKMTKIYERSHKEAIALNDEYNRLVENVANGKNTVEELHAFEASELGMDEKKEAA